MIEGMYGIDNDGNCTFINKAATQMLGYTREECMGKNMHSLIHSKHKNGNDYPETECPITKTRDLPEGCSVDNEVFWRANGSPFEVYYTSSPIFVNGTTKGTVITFNDTSEKKRQKAELMRIMDSSLDVICTINSSGCFVKVSAAAKQILGYDPDFLANKPYIDFVHPADQQMTIIAANEVMGGLNVTNFENRYIHKSGAMVPMVWSSHWDAAEQLLFCIGRDATEKILSEKAVVDSERKYKNLFESNPTPMAIWDFETLQIIDCNEEALSKYGYTREEFLNLTIKDLRPSEEVKLIESFVKTEDDYGKVHQKIWKHKKKSGELMYMDVKGHLIQHEGRRVSLVAANDMTAILKAKEELRKSEEKYRTLFLYSAIPKWIFDMNCLSILDVNEAAIVHYGYSREEFLAMKISDLRSAEELPEFGSFLDKLKQNPLKADFGKFTHIKKDGTAIKAEVSITRFVFDDRDCGMSEINDVTNREKALADLVDKEKKLEISNQRFNYATKATSDAILDWDIIAGTIYWGEGYEKIFGYELNGEWAEAGLLADLFHPDDLQRIINSITAVINSDQTNWENEFRFAKKDGSFAFVKAKGIIIRNEGGMAIRMVGAMQDISKQKEEEIHLKLLNRKLREVSWMQSHIIRAPLSRIMGLIPLLTQIQIDQEERDKVLEYILLSANELDDVIKNIIETTITLDM